MERADQYFIPELQKRSKDEFGQKTGIGPMESHDDPEDSETDG